MQLHVKLTGTKGALTRRASKIPAPMSSYTHTLNVNTHMDLVWGTLSSVHALVSACLLPSEARKFLARRLVALALGDDLLLHVLPMSFLPESSARTLPSWLPDALLAHATCQHRQVCLSQGGLSGEIPLQVVAVLKSSWSCVAS